MVFMYLRRSLFLSSRDLLKRWMVQSYFSHIDPFSHFGSFNLEMTREFFVPLANV